MLPNVNVQNLSPIQFETMRLIRYWLLPSVKHVFVANNVFGLFGTPQQEELPSFLTLQPHMKKKHQNFQTLGCRRSECLQSVHDLKDSDVRQAGASSAAPTRPLVRMRRSLLGLLGKEAPDARSLQLINCQIRGEVIFHVAQKKTNNSIHFLLKTNIIFFNYASSSCTYPSD